MYMTHSDGLAAPKPPWALRGGLRRLRTALFCPALRQTKTKREMQNPALTATVFLSLFYQKRDGAPSSAVLFLSAALPPNMSTFLHILLKNF